MVLKIHGSMMSTCTKRALCVLAEKKVSFELVAVDLAAGEHKSEKYMKLQPFGKVPALEDDGFIVYESRAIAKYIAKKYAAQGTKLMPDDSDLKAYGLFEQACELEKSYFDPPAGGLVFEKVIKAMLGMGDADEALVKKHTDQLDVTFAVYEQILSKQSYLAGDEITLADLSHLPYGAILKKCGHADQFAKYPAVAKWFAALEARESWAKLN